MNENWPEIVETLIPYFETNSVEGDYQRENRELLEISWMEEDQWNNGIPIYITDRQ